MTRYTSMILGVLLLPGGLRMASRFALTALLTIMLAACGSSPEGTDVATDIAIVDEHRGCTGEELKGGDCTNKRRYVRDELELVQGGDHPTVAGCHVAYSDAACTKDREVYIGDQCIGTGKNKRLKEWTNAKCHKPGGGNIDRKPYDCDKYCKSIYHAAGECRETAEGMCGRWGSAYCKCTGPT